MHKFLGFLFAVGFLFLTNTVAFAATACTKDPDGTYVCPAAGVIQLREMITRAINISVGIGFIALTIWLIWSAVKLFILSGGEAKALTQAWSSVLWAFSGMLFLILSWLILKLIASFTGVPVTDFCLGFKPYCI